MKRGGRETGGRLALRYAVRDLAGLVHLQVAAPQEFRPRAIEVSVQGRAGEVEFGGARIEWCISARRGSARVKAAAQRECFDAGKIGSRIVLRHWQPGDRFQPIGMASSVKLQDFFTNRKVPQNQRRRLIVGATAKGEVFWVEGMRISERFKLSNGTIRRLQWRWKRL